MRILLVFILLVSLVAVCGAVEEPDSGVMAEHSSESLEERIRRSSFAQYYSIDETGKPIADGTGEGRYNRYGDEIEFVYFDEDGNISSVYSQEHDYWENGVLKRTDMYSDIYSDGGLDYVVEFDDEGRKVKTVSHSLIAILGERTTRYRYDSKGREIGATSYDADGMVQYTVAFEYEIVGDRLVVTSFNDGEKTSVTYFDENDLRIRDEYYEDGILDWYWLREYNQFGDEIRAERFKPGDVMDRYTETTYVYRD